MFNLKAAQVKSRNATVLLGLSIEIGPNFARTIDGTLGSSEKEMFQWPFNLTPFDTEEAFGPPKLRNLPTRRCVHLVAFAAAFDTPDPNRGHEAFCSAPII
jgi:hypothetical protein